jgi:TRAP-type C4-dicarboxylate transport system permease large subunit
VLFTSFAALLEGLPAVIILGPLFYPLAAQMGVSALHFSILGLQAQWALNLR